MTRQSQYPFQADLEVRSFTEFSEMLFSFPLIVKYVEIYYAEIAHQQKEAEMSVGATVVKQNLGKGNTSIDKVI